MKNTENTKENLTIREFAEKAGHEIVGRLERHPELENRYDTAELRKEKSHTRAYLDEAGNEYYIGKNEVCIITADGGVI